MQNGTAGVYNCEVRPVKTTVQTVDVAEGVSAIQRSDAIQLIFAGIWVSMGKSYGR